jgi:GNAT superfamily N-acetyltransferase
MNLVKCEPLSKNQFEQINLLWNKMYPIQLSNRFPLLLEEARNCVHYLMKDDNETICAWAVVFEKDNETRFSIIVDEKHQKKGLGKMLIQALKNDFTHLYGWVIDHDEDLKANGENYRSPLHFYLNNGFQIVPNARIENEFLKAVKISCCK